MKTPLCISCKHHSGTHTKWCNIPVRVSIVDGSAVRWTCEDMRGEIGKCKRQAILFEAIPGEPIQYLPEPVVEGSPF